MEIEFPNLIRRSPIESARYEFKQGIASLGAKREINQSLLRKLPKVASAIANTGPDGDGYIILGVADRAEHAHQIKQLDSIIPLTIGSQHLVGVDRECVALGIDMATYLRKIVQGFQDAPLGTQLKGDILASIDTVSFSGRSYVVVRVPAQRELSEFDGDYFIRDGEDLRKMSTSEALAASKRFLKA